MATEDTLSKPTAAETADVEHTRCGQCYRPSVDILEKPDELLVLADVPGAKADGIDVKFEDGTLSILAEVAPRQDDSQRYLAREYGVGNYYRTFQISEAIDASQISADYADGVLSLHLPKSEAIKPRTIKVNAT